MYYNMNYVCLFTNTLPFFVLLTASISTYTKDTLLNWLLKPLCGGVVPPITLVVQFSLFHVPQEG